MRLWIIIETIQVKLKKDFHIECNSHISCNINEERQSNDILTKDEINSLRKWNVSNNENDISQYWLNMKGWIVTAVEFKYPKSKTDRGNIDNTLSNLRSNLRNIRTPLNYEPSKMGKIISLNNGEYNLYLLAPMGAPQT